MMRGIGRQKAEGREYVAVTATDCKHIARRKLGLFQLFRLMMIWRLPDSRRWGLPSVDPGHPRPCRQQVGNLPHLLSSEQPVWMRADQYFRKQEFNPLLR